MVRIRARAALPYEDKRTGSHNPYAAFLNASEY